MNSVFTKSFRSNPYKYLTWSSNLSFTPYLRRQRSCPWPDSILQAIQIDQTLSTTRDQVRGCKIHLPHSPFCLPGSLNDSCLGPWNPSIPYRSQKARWPLRMHPLRLLFYLVPFILVEQWRIPWPCSTIAILPLASWFARWAQGRAKVDAR